MPVSDKRRPPGRRQGWRRYDFRDEGGRAASGTAAESNAGSSCRVRDWTPSTTGAKVTHAGGSITGVHPAPLKIPLLPDVPPALRRSAVAPNPKAMTSMNSTVMNLSELKKKPATELVDMAAALDLEGGSRLRKQDLIFAILKAQARKGEDIVGEGVVEILQDGFGF